MGSCNSEKQVQELRCFKRSNSIKDCGVTSAAEFVGVSVMLLLFHGPSIEELPLLVQKKRGLKRKWGSNKSTYNVLYIKTIKLTFQSHPKVGKWLQEVQIRKFHIETMNVA
jgi:hypothetical protein